ncbi:MAG TPA: amidohydrolase family protein, partial [Thermoanaerobaculia bacterium]|nr:amidohydrolase family protein [Thermoanaerobaculia bacterium]
FALTGAKVIAAPGRVFDPGVVVIRGGVVEAVGDAGKIRVPADARVFELAGKTIHAAYIDPYVSVDRLEGKPPHKPLDEEETPGGTGGRPTPAAAAPLRPSQAETNVLDKLDIRERVAATYRGMGFAAAAAVPSAGFLRGKGAVVSLADDPRDDRVLEADSGEYVSLEPERFDFANFQRATYPASKMGAVAFVRQNLLDALWWRDAEAAYGRRPTGQPRPPYEASAKALIPAAEGKERVVFEATDALSLVRAGKIAREFHLNALYVGAGDEYRLAREVAAMKPDLILRIDFPRPYRLESEEEWLEVPLERLRAIDRAPSNPKWMKDSGLSFSFTTAGLENAEDFPRRVREAIARGLSRDDALAAVTAVPARQLGLADRLGTIEAGKIANLAVETGEPFAEESRVTEVWIDGRQIEIAEPKKPEGAPHPGLGEGAESLAVDVRPLPAREGGPLAQPRSIVVRGATIWTEGPSGTMESTDLLVVDGRIAAVGKNLSAPAGAVEIDGHGKHVTPGVIDAHSHTAIDGEVNEFTHTVTAEVRIKDVLDPLDVAIYRELAGGTTVANVLHGSANAIGGQTTIVKWRRGGGPDDLVFAGAPEGIKFALGENPKQSNFQVPGRPPRYPATRMGVVNLIRERFTAARDYRKRQEEYRKAASVKGASPLPVRTDLQLEAVAEILEGKRQIHCHSYRKDEILEMIRVADDFGVRIATFQHVLEGYKVADEIAKHGAGGSAFSDWWAYKPEAYDAIPYNGALMRERGVVVSFNSDSDELARRLNWDAAKAVKWGGVPPADALAFVTINPARQLGIEKRVGSLEPGKDGDFVIWSGDPLATSSMALETWIEGKKYFDRSADLSARPALEKERADLVAKAKKLLESERRASAAGGGAQAGEQREPEPARVPTRAPERGEQEPLSTPARPPAPTPTPGAPR